MWHKKTIITNSILGTILLVVSFFVFNLNVHQSYLTIAAPLANGNRDSKQVALIWLVETQAEADNLATIMSTMTTAQAQATFFITGNLIINNLATVHSIVEQFELGNYGFTAQPLNSNDKNFITQSITNSDCLVQSLFDYQMQFFTPPANLYNKNTLAMATNLGYRTVMPTKRPVSIDWATADTNLVTAYATNQTKAGDIIALRPVTATMQALTKIIACFNAQDLTVTSLATLLMPKA